jgi:potassium-transporting ATPase potassium-binding subunit
MEPGAQTAGEERGKDSGHLTTALATLMGRFGLAIPALALAGLLARQGKAPVTIGILRTDSLVLGFLLLASLVIMTTLSYLPLLVLGPFSNC